MLMAQDMQRVRISLDHFEGNGGFDFISHAHSDHIGAAKRSSNIISTPQTAQLIEAAYNISITTLSISKGINLIPAGHMLGSSQLLVNDAVSNEQIVYTGDFQMSKSKANGIIEVPKVDTVILDSTFCTPDILFGPKEDTYREIVEWAKFSSQKGPVIFSAYKMGKAQEIIYALNEANITPIVSKKIAKINQVYIKNNIPLNYYCPSLGDGVDELKSNFIGITEQRELPMLKKVISSMNNCTVHTAHVSGFAKIFNYNCDAQFTLSDHADFAQSISYIKQSGAKKVYTYGKNSGEFARNLCLYGIDAKPLPDSHIEFALNIK